MYALHVIITVFKIGLVCVLVGAFGALVSIAVRKDNDNNDD